MTRTLEKPWLLPWLDTIKGLRPAEQTIGLHLAYFADTEGFADEFTWDDLGERVGMAGDTIRKLMKREDTDLLATGLVERHERKIGNAMAMPLFRLALERIEHPEQEDQEEEVGAM